MKHYFLFCLAFFSCCAAQAQFTLSNQRSFGGTGNEELTYKLITQSDGTILVGSSNSPVSGNKTALPKGGLDIWMVKIDENQNILWDKTFGGGADESAWDVWSGGSAIYVVSHSLSGISGDKTMDSYGGEDIWMLCLNMQGTILWQQQYGGSGADYSPKLIEHSDTSLLIVSASSSPVSGNKTAANVGSSDTWILEVLKADGQIIQQRTVGSPSAEITPTIGYASTPGNYILRMTSYEGAGGDKTEPGYGDADVWIVELDGNLNVLGDKCFGGDTQDRNSLAFFDDGTYYYISAISFSGVSGNKTSVNFGNEDFWLLKLNHDLTPVWDKSYGGAGAEAGSVIHRNANGRFVLSGPSVSVGGTGNKTAPVYGGYDCWLLVLDENGGIIAQETFGGTMNDAGFAFQNEDSGTGLTLLITSASPISGNKTVNSFGQSDWWLATIDASAYLDIVDLPEPSIVAVYPNPFNDNVVFALAPLAEDATIRIYTADGRTIAEIAVPKHSNAVEWLPGSLSGSLFLYEITGSSIHRSGKLLRN